MSRVDIRGRKDELVDLPGPTVLELACSGRAARSAMSVGNVRPQFPSAMSAGRQRLSWAYLRIADCRVRRFGDRCALYPEVPPGLGPDGGVTPQGDAGGSTPVRAGNGEWISPVEFIVQSCVDLH